MLIKGNCLVPCEQTVEQDGIMLGFKAQGMGHSGSCQVVIG